MLGNDQYLMPHVLREPGTLKPKQRHATCCLPYDVVSFPQLQGWRPLATEIYFASKLEAGGVPVDIMIN